MEQIGTGIWVIGERAPEFTAVTTQGKLSFPQDYHGKWVVLYYYPCDFDPVSTTEIIIFQSMLQEFQSINTEVIGFSADSLACHISWLNKIKEFAWKDMKHVEVSFPILADTKKEIAESYGLLHKNPTDGKAVRAVFLIDPQGCIRSVTYYPASVGINGKEIFRLVSAIQKAEREKICTPSNWMPGDDVILTPPETYKEAAERNLAVSESVYSLDWFLSFRQSEWMSDNKSREPEASPYPSVYPVRNRLNSRRQGSN